jgi:hypothetical protein
MKTVIISYLKSKAFWLGVAQVIGGVAELVTNNPGAGIGFIIGGVLTIIVRAFTNTAIAGTPGSKVPGVKVKK